MRRIVCDHDMPSATDADLQRQRLRLQPSLDQLRKLIDAKLEAGDTLDTDATFGEQPDDDDADDDNVVNLMAALKASLDKRDKSA